MLLTFKNKVGNMVAVKAIDVMYIAQDEDDGQPVCRIANYPSDDKDQMPHYYVSIEEFTELRNRWLFALQAWNVSSEERAFGVYKRG